MEIPQLVHFRQYLRNINTPLTFHLIEIDTVADRMSVPCLIRTGHHSGLSRAAASTTALVEIGQKARYPIKIENIRSGTRRPRSVAGELEVCLIQEPKSSDKLRAAIPN